MEEQGLPTRFGGLFCVSLAAKLKKKKMPQGHFLKLITKYENISGISAVCISPYEWQYRYAPPELTARLRSSASHRVGNFQTQP